MEQAQKYPTSSKNDTNKSFKPRNPNLYEGNLYIECYYFCHKYKKYFEVPRLLCYKYISLAILSKDHILNC